MKRVATLALFSSMCAMVAAQGPPAVPGTNGAKACQLPSSDGAKGTKAEACKAVPAAGQDASQRFPYPGEAPPKARSAPAVTTSPTQPASPGTQFPYPGDPAAASDSSSSSSRSDSSSSSSSSSSNSEPEASKTDDGERQGSVRRRLPKPERLQSDEDREAEDLEVAKFYAKAGNLNAAYLRLRDAVKLQPNDSEAHFAMAEIAQHLKKREEAAVEYDTYLRLEPDGDRAKAAQRALATLR